MQDLYIPLEVEGVISTFKTRKPTEKELDELFPIDMTSEAPWDPQSDVISCNEKHATYNYRTGKISAVDREVNLSAIISATRRDSNNQSELMDFGPVFDQATFCRALTDFDRSYTIASATSSTRRSGISASELASRWCISPELAERTLKCTSQDGMRY